MMHAIWRVLRMASELLASGDLFFCSTETSLSCKNFGPSIYVIKGSLEEILPSYEKLRSVCVQVRDAKRSRLTVARVGTLGAARLRRGCGAGAAAAPVEIEA